MSSSVVNYPSVHRDPWELVSDERQKNNDPAATRKMKMVLQLNLNAELISDPRQFSVAEALINHGQWYNFTDRGWLWWCDSRPRLMKGTQSMQCSIDIQNTPNFAYMDFGHMGFFLWFFGYTDFSPNKLFHLDHFSRDKRGPYIWNWVYRCAIKLFALRLHLLWPCFLMFPWPPYHVIIHLSF